jgi:hypothetical protein
MRYKCLSSTLCSTFKLNFPNISLKKHPKFFLKQKKKGITSAQTSGLKPASGRNSVAPCPVPRVTERLPSPHGVSALLRPRHLHSQGLHLHRVGRCQKLMLQDLRRGQRRQHVVHGWAACASADAYASSSRALPLAYSQHRHGSRTSSLYLSKQPYIDIYFLTLR